MAYLKSRAKWLILLAVMWLLFMTVLLLYHVPPYAVRDGGLLCLFAAAVFLTADGIAFYRRHRELERQMGQVCLSVDHLPMPCDLTEEDYQELIRILFREKQMTQDRADLRYMDMMEYYTLWVHQIKTPIAALRLLLQNEDSRPYLEMRSELLRIEQYVDMVLCYLRLDGDTTDFVLRRCDIDRILRQAVRKFAGQFIQKKIRLEYRPVKTAVLMDEKWLQFVVEQLLSNALKYTPEGGCVTMEMEKDECLCIRDSGIGIAPEDLPRVFQKGFTGYNGRSDKRASGIGLFLCKQILEKMGHTICIESETGQGTVVRVGLGRREMMLE